jgi:hypothetical protein
MVNDLAITHGWISQPSSQVTALGANLALNGVSTDHVHSLSHIGLIVALTDLHSIINTPKSLQEVGGCPNWNCHSTSFGRISRELLRHSCNLHNRVDHLFSRESLDVVMGIIAIVCLVGDVGGR